jgi:hypothetical protein
MKIPAILGILACMLAVTVAASEANPSPSGHLLVAASNGQQSEEKKAGEESKKDEDPAEKEEPEEEEKKERYEKKEDRTQETSSGDWFTECLSACLFSALHDLCSSWSEDSDGEPPPYEITHEFETPLSGVIESEQGLVGDIMAWGLPGGESSAAAIVFSVPVGGEVFIWRKATAHEDTAWLEVSRHEVDSSRGWVRAQDVMIEETHAPVLLAEAATDSAGAGEAQEEASTWPYAWLRGDASWCTFPGEPLSGEYDGRGFQGKGMLHLLTSGSLQVGLGVGFTDARGEPVAVYDTPSLFDEPQSSKINMFSIEFQAGQRLVFGTGLTSFTWGIGPTIYRVKESAEINHTEFEEGEEIGSGTRTDTMTGWTWGFDARISVEYAIHGDGPLGISTGVSFVRWDSKQEESLSLDWLEKDYFITYQLGVTFGALLF